VIPFLLVACTAPSLRATIVVEAAGDAERAVNGVRGAGARAGSTDVFSLGLQPGVDDTLVLAFEGVAVDVDGDDLAVFENPFDVAERDRFMDPVIVEVSADCTDYVAFRWERTDADPAQWSGDPAAWSGFAGITPVNLHEEDTPVDPLSPAAGGDTFDLAHLDPDDPISAAVLADGVACIRLSAAQLWTDPTTELAIPGHPASNGPDIDGVYAAMVLR